MMPSCLRVSTKWKSPFSRSNARKDIIYLQKMRNLISRVRVIQRDIQNNLANGRHSKSYYYQQLLGKTHTNPTLDYPRGWHQTLMLFLMLCNACRQEPNIAVLWEALPAAEWDRWQIQIRTAHHWTENGDPMKELEEGLKELKRSVTPEEDQQCQLTRTPQSSQRPSLQPRSIYGLVHDPQHICRRDCLDWPQWERMSLTM